MEYRQRVGCTFGDLKKDSLMEDQRRKSVKSCQESGSQEELKRALGVTWPWAADHSGGQRATWHDSQTPGKMS